MNKQKVIVISFFFLYFVLGLIIFDDYGSPCDRYEGLSARWFDYVEFRDNVTYEDITHGPAFEFMVYGGSKLLGISTPPQIELYRHFAFFFVFFLGSIVFYFILKRFFRWEISLIGSLLMILHPRIFTHSFANSFDISFLAFYIFCTFTLLKFMEKNDLKWAVIHGIMCGLIFDIRSVGIIFLPLTFLMMGIDSWKKKKYKMNVKNGLIFLAVFFGITVIFFPYYWDNTFQHILNVLTGSANTTHLLNDWIYNFKWILVTTPTFIIGLFIIGFVKVVIDFSGSKKKGQLFVLNFLFLVPLIMPIIFKSYLHDGWRHHYFVYPFIVFFAIWGFDWCLSKKIMKPIAIAIVALGILSTAVFMVDVHPNQQVYVNTFAGSDLESGKFDNALDYWGFSYKNGWDFIYNEYRNVSVYSTDYCGKIYHSIFGVNSSIVLVDEIDGSDLVITSFRYGDVDLKEIYSLEYKDQKYMAVFENQE